MKTTNKKSGTEPTNSVNDDLDCDTETSDDGGIDESSTAAASSSSAPSTSYN